MAYWDRYFGDQPMPEWVGKESSSDAVWETWLQFQRNKAAFGTRFVSSLLNVSGAGFSPMDVQRLDISTPLGAGERFTSLRVDPFPYANKPTRAVTPDQYRRGGDASRQYMQMLGNQNLVASELTEKLKGPRQFYSDQAAAYLSDREMKGITQLGGDFIKDLIANHPALRGRIETNLQRMAEERTPQYERIISRLRNNQQASNDLRIRLEQLGDVDTPERVKILRELGRLGEERRLLVENGQNIKSDLRDIDRTFSNLDRETPAGISRGYGRSSFWEDVAAGPLDSHILRQGFEPVGGQGYLFSTTTAARAARQELTELQRAKQVAQNAMKLEHSVFDLYASGQLGSATIAGSGTFQGQPATLEQVQMSEYARHSRTREWMRVEDLQRIDPNFKGALNVTREGASVQSAGVLIKPLQFINDRFMTEAIFNLGPKPPYEPAPLWALNRIDPDLSFARMGQFTQATKGNMADETRDSDAVKAQELVRGRVAAKIRRGMGDAPSDMYAVSQLGDNAALVKQLVLGDQPEIISSRKVAEELIAGNIFFPKWQDRRVLRTWIAPEYSNLLRRFLTKAQKGNAFASEVVEHIFQFAPKLAHELANTPGLSATKANALLVDAAKNMEDLEGLTSKKSIEREFITELGRQRGLAGAARAGTLPLQDAALANIFAGNLGIDEVSEGTRAVASEEATRMQALFRFMAGNPSLENERETLRRQVRQQGTAIREARALLNNIETKRRRGIPLTPREFQGMGLLQRRINRSDATQRDALRRMEEIRWEDLQRGLLERRGNLLPEVLRNYLQISPALASNMATYMNRGLHISTERTPLFGRQADIEARLEELDQYDRPLTFRLPTGDEGQLRVQGFKRVQVPGVRGIGLEHRVFEDTTQEDPRRYHVTWGLSGNRSQRLKTLTAMGYSEDAAARMIRSGMTKFSSVMRFDPLVEEIGTFTRSTEELRARAAELNIPGSERMRRETLQRRVVRAEKGLAQNQLFDFYFNEYQNEFARTHHVQGRYEREWVDAVAKAQELARLASEEGMAEWEENFRGLNIGRLTVETDPQFHNLAEVMPSQRYRTSSGWVGDVLGGPNTTTRDRQALLRGIWERVKETPWQQRRMSIFDRKYLPRIDNRAFTPVGWAETQAELGQELADRGLDFGTVQNISKEFGQSRARNWINTDSLDPEASRALNEAQVVDDTTARVVLGKSRYLYSPLAIGSKIQIPELGHGQITLGELWARAVAYRGHDQEVEELGAKLTSRNALKHMADAIAKQFELYKDPRFYKALPPTMQRQLLAMDRAPEGIAPAPPPPPGEVPPIPPGTGGAEEAGKAAAAAEDVITSKGFYNTLKHLMRHNRVAQTIAISGTALTGFAFMGGRDKDKTEDDYSPPNLPGGSPYETGALNRLMTQPPQMFGSPVNAGGVRYVVSANPYGQNNNYDAAMLGSQIQSIVGAVPQTTIYNSSQNVADQRQQYQDSIVGSYS